MSDRSKCIALAIASVLVGSQKLQAASGTWTYNTNNTTQSWGTAARWASSIIADGADSTADFSTLNITGDRTVTLDTARTIGHLKFGDTGATSSVYHGWTIADGGVPANTLTLSAAAPGPSITVNTNGSASISTELRGTEGFTKLGSGILTLTGPTTINSLTGGITSNGGTLRIGDGTTGAVASQALNFTGNGTVNFNEAAGSTQSMTALNFAASHGTLTSTYAGSGVSSLTFGSLTRSAGATGSFDASGGVNGTDQKIVLTGQSTGFLDRGLFFGSTSSNYAYYDSNGYVRGVNWGVDAPTIASGTLSDGTFAQATAAVTGQGSVSLVGLNLVNTVNSGKAFTLAPDATLTTNGILRSGNGGSSSTTTISGGTGAAVRAGFNQELVIRTDQSNDLLTISAPIIANGTNALTKSGAGTLTLSNNANAYTGTTTVIQGTLIADANNALGTGAVNVVGGTLRAAASRTIANDVNLVGGGLSFGSSTGAFSGTIDVQKSASITNSGGTFTSAGEILLAAGQSLTVSSGTVTINAPISGEGSLRVDASTTINSNNTGYSGTTSLINGTLALGHNNALGTGTFALAQRDVPTTIQSVNGSGARTITNALALSGKANYTTTFGTAASDDLTFTGNGTINGLMAVINKRTEFSGNLSGSLGGTNGLLLLGPSTNALVLSGNNTVSGKITINGGTLLVNNTVGSGTGTASVLLTSLTNIQVNGPTQSYVGNGTLGGSGTINGAVTVTNGTLAPGNSAGKLTLGSTLALGSEAITAMEIGGSALGTQYDHLAITGAVTYGGALNISLIDGYEFTQNQSYNLFDFASVTVDSNFGSVTVDGVPLAFAAGSWTGTQDTKTYTFTLSDGVLAVAIPEPTTLTALGMFGMALLRRRRA